MERRSTLEQLAGGRQIIVLANREPYSHERDAEGGIVTRHAASGLVHAVEPLLARCGGVWVAHGSGTADRAVVDAASGVAVPPEKPAYRLRRVWLDEHEYAGYYNGFANEALWPLCHRAFVKPVFRPSDLDAYWTANGMTANLTGAWRVTVYSDGKTSMKSPFKREVIRSIAVWPGGDRPGPTTSDKDCRGNFFCCLFRRLCRCLRLRNRWNFSRRQRRAV